MPTAPAASTPTVIIAQPAVAITLPAILPTKDYPCDPEYCIQPGEYPLSRPILPPGNDRVEENYRYGYTQDGLREPHHGVEFTNPSGTPIHAAADGRVFYAGDDSDQVFGLYPNFYGNLVILEHNLPGFSAPVYTLYGHLSDIAVQTGDAVTRGDEIGTVGLTGSAIGSHLHFEVRLGEPAYDRTANPEFFLPPITSPDPEASSGLLIGRIEDQFGGALKIPIAIQPVAGDGSLGAGIFPELYGAGVPSIPGMEENFLLASLPAGKYRLAFVNYSRVFERTVEIFPGRVTFLKMTATP